MTKTIPVTQPERRDRLLRERVHDPYQTRRKLPEPTTCPSCGAVYRDGRWQWAEARPPAAHEEPCPACRRIKEDCPAGIIRLEGAFLVSHRKEILQLVRNTEARENSQHPLHRIMAITPAQDGVTVTTTDIHLARRIGEAVSKAYGGALDYRYADEAALLRVHWRRDDTPNA